MPTLSGQRGFVIQKKIEKVKKKATKIITGLSGLRYKERLHVLLLPTLRYRQLREDMIQLYLYSMLLKSMLLTSMM